MAPILAPPELKFPRLPGQDDLPYSDGIPLESHEHVLQNDLLTEPLDSLWAGKREFFVGSDMFLYFSTSQLKSESFRGPDVFVVLDVPNRPRKSWVVWEEGKGPDVIVEIVSESTRETDRVTKKQVYQDQLRVPEYFWYDPLAGELAGFVMRNGVYEPIPPDEQGRLSSERLGLLLTLWTGEHRRVTESWVRWAFPDGTLVPTGGERAEEAERHAAEVQRRAERLGAKLQAMGIDPDA
jgi:Uma2 family endonuclease